MKYIRILKQPGVHMFIEQADVYICIAAKLFTDAALMFEDTTTFFIGESEKAAKTDFVMIKARMKRTRYFPRKSSPGLSVVIHVFSWVVVARIGLPENFPKSTTAGERTSILSKSNRDYKNVEPRRITTTRSSRPGWRRFHGSRSPGVSHGSNTSRIVVFAARVSFAGRVTAAIDAKFGFLPRQIMGRQPSSPVAGSKRAHQKNSQRSSLSSKSAHHTIPTGRLRGCPKVFSPAAQSWPGGKTLFSKNDTNSFLSPRVEALCASRQHSFPAFGCLLSRMPTRSCARRPV